jgi:uncharacterized protein (DUF885 family)
MEPEEVAQRVAASRARRNPAWATMVGIRGHDHELRAVSSASYLDDVKEVEALLAEARGLSPGLARTSLVGLLELESYELSEIRKWARDPDVVTELFDHLFYVMLASHLSPDEKRKALVARVAAGPAYLRGARERFDEAEVPRLWVDGALRSLDAAPAFLAALSDLSVEVPDALRYELVEQATWLRALHSKARGSPALGAARFRRLLVLRQIHESPEELTKLGEALGARFEAAMEEAARTVLAEAGRRVESSMVHDALAVVREDHPTSFAEVLAEHEAAIIEARDFVVGRGLVTPTDVPLDIVETPAFLRHLVPFAAYIGPARFAQERHGTYLVTPKTDLSAFARADIRNTTVHEAWPGHHLQLSIAAAKAPLWAWLADAIDLAEGWALYCEAMMGEHGYTSKPGERLIRDRDARWRALRIVLDIGLHTRGLDPTDAATSLARETGMSREEADAEVLRYTLAPAYNLSYMVGRVKLEALRSRWLATGRSERAFHDAVLAAGPLPISLLGMALGSDAS